MQICPRFRLFFALLAIALPGRAGAAVIQVPADHATITAALAASSPNDEIQVAAGTYAPSTNGETFPLLLNKAGIQLVGAGDAVTILDSEGGAQVIMADAAGGPRVSGFTLTGGRAARGSGVFVNSGDVQIDHTLITDNGSNLRGAGIFVKADATPWIHHNVIWENFDTDPEGTEDPHGVVFQDTAAGIVEHNLIGRTDGNGLLTSAESQPVVRHNIFLENGQVGPPLRGRGICWFSSSPALVSHNLFHANQVAALLWTDGGGNLSAAAANDVDANDGVFGNLDADPLLADPDLGDFSLTMNSPAIDAGDPTLPLDPDGTIADLGPFYFDQGANAVASLPRQDGILRLAIQPNPFRWSATLRWRGEPVAVDRFEILDATGRRIHTLGAAGRDAVEWDGRDSTGRSVAPGVYFARAIAGTVVQTAQIVRIR